MTWAGEGLIATNFTVVELDQRPRSEQARGSKRNKSKTK